MLNSVKIVANSFQQGYITDWERCDMSLYEYPCNNCFVKPICQLYCSKVFDYINFVADNFGEQMADNNLNIFNKSVPNNIKRKIEQFHKFGARFSHPPTIEIKQSDIIW